MYSDDLNSSLGSFFVEKPYELARRMICQRLARERNIRESEIKKMTANDIPNPEMFKHATGKILPVPTEKRERIEELNVASRKVLKDALDQDDVVNEWEVNLMGPYVALKYSRAMNFVLGMIRFLSSMTILYADSDNLLFLMKMSTVFFLPFAFVLSLPILVLSMQVLYITDSELRSSFAYVIFVYRFIKKSVCGHDESNDTNSNSNSNSNASDSNNDAAKKKKAAVNVLPTKDLEMTDVPASSSEPTLNPIFAMTNIDSAVTVCDAIPEANLSSSSVSLHALPQEKATSSPIHCEATGKGLQSTTFEANESL